MSDYNQTSALIEIPSRDPLDPSTTTSSSTSESPRTPTDLHARAVQQASHGNYDGFDPQLFEMSAGGRGTLHHSASYTYGGGEGQVASGVSQERSTVSPSQNGSNDIAQQPYILQKNLTGAAPSASDSNYWHAPPPLNTSMLPPLSAHTAREHSSQGTWVYHAGYSSYCYPYATSHHHGYRGVSPHFYTSQPPPHHAPHQLYSPAPVGYQAYPSGQYAQPATIPPSAFQEWDERDRAKSDDVFSAASVPVNGLDEVEYRRGSTASGKNEEKYETQEYGSPRSEEEHREGTKGQLVYTTDSEVRQTTELRRICFNCQCIDPPSWRKSLIALGRILCNKCGIFERTHKRPRPVQGDDQKLRRQAALKPVYRRERPPALQVMPTSEESPPVSPVPSAYSIPSQTTPLPAHPPAYTFPYDGHPNSAPPMSRVPSVIAQHRYYSQTPVLYPLASPMTSGMVDRTPVGMRGHGNSSPYAHAYAKRSASYHTSAISRTASNTEHMNSSPNWNTGRRHSDTEIAGDEASQ